MPVAFCPPQCRFCLTGRPADCPAERLTGLLEWLEWLGGWVAGWLGGWAAGRLADGSTAGLLLSWWTAGSLLAGSLLAGYLLAGAGCRLPTADCRAAVLVETFSHWEGTPAYKAERNWDTSDDLSCQELDLL
jgi:hypothetical protein